MENYENIQQSILNFVANYEDAKAGRIDPYEKMLRSLEAPYQKMPDHDRVLALLRQTFPPDPCGFLSVIQLVHSLPSEADDGDHDGSQDHQLIEDAAVGPLDEVVQHPGRRYADEL